MGINPQRLLVGITTYTYLLREVLDLKAVVVVLDADVVEVRHQILKAFKLRSPEAIQAMFILIRCASSQAHNVCRRRRQKRKRQKRNKSWLDGPLDDRGRGMVWHGRRFPSMEIHAIQT